MLFINIVMDAIILSTSILTNTLIKLQKLDLLNRHKSKSQHRLWFVSRRKNGNCIKKPCKKDPVDHLEVAAQKNSGTTGGTFGCTRNGGSCSGYSGGRTKKHEGIDLKNAYGAPIYAMYDGFIYNSRYDDDAGYYTRIQSTVNGKTFIHEYFHLQSGNRIKTNTNGTLRYVKAGDIIGYQGNSGNLKDAIARGDTVSHVHIKISEHDGSSKWGYKNYNPVDPKTYFSTTINSNGTSTYQNCN